MKTIISEILPKILEWRHGQYRRRGKHKTLVKQPVYLPLLPGGKRALVPLAETGSERIYPSGQTSKDSGKSRLVVPVLLCLESQKRYGTNMATGPPPLPDHRPDLASVLGKKATSVAYPGKCGISGPLIRADV